MRVSDTGALWWKTAVVYCLDVQTFMDWNGDGTGDFVGSSDSRRATCFPRLKPAGTGGYTTTVYVVVG